MKKLFILLTLTFLLSSCFGGEEVTVEIPQAEDTIIEETIVSREEGDVTSENEDTENKEGIKLEEGTGEVKESLVRESVPIEKVEIKETGTENEDYDIRSNIESDPDASVVTEETFVVPTAPVVQEVKVNDVEVLPEDEALADDILSELLEGIVDGYDVIEENE